MDAGRGITLPSNSALSEELDFTSYDDPEDMKDDLEDLKEDSLERIAARMNQRLENIQDSKALHQRKAVYRQRLARLSASLDNFLAPLLGSGTELEEIEASMEERVESWWSSFSSSDIGHADSQVQWETEVESDGSTPGFDGLSGEASAALVDEFGNRWSISAYRNSELESVETSTIGRSESGQEFEFQSRDGFRVIVFNRESRFHLKHLIRSKSDINGSVEVDAQLSADLMSEVQSALDSYAGPGGSGVTVNRADLTVDAHGEGSVQGQLHTESEIGLDIIEQERGVHLVLPVAETSTGGKLVLETGVKQRVDVVAFRLMSSRAYGNYSANGTATVNSTLDSSTSVNPSGLPAGIPISYLPASATTVDRVDSRQDNFSDSTSGSGSVDIKQELENNGIPTSVSSRREYILVPVGIGFYGSGGSHIRLLVDLKPERIGQPLVIRGPKNAAEVNKYLGMIGGAQLDGELRGNFDAFSILAGFNTGFKTVEIGLGEVTGDDQAISAPLHAHAQIYFGVETDSLSIRQTNTVRYDVNKAVGSAHLEVVKQFDSGWSLGFMTGYEKHISVHGLPEYTRSDQISGSRDASHTLPQGVVSGTANYTAGHDTVVNEGATGYTDVNKIPAKVVLGIPVSSSDDFLISGQTTFSDGNESQRMQLEKAGGGLGWQRRMENGSFQVEANAFQDYSTVEATGRPQVGFGLSIGGTF